MFRLRYYWSIALQKEHCFFGNSISSKMGILKGTAALMISMFYQKELYEPWILKQVSSKLVEKWGSYGHF